MNPISKIRRLYMKHRHLMLLRPQSEEDLRRYPSFLVLTRGTYNCSGFLPEASSIVRKQSESFKGVNV